MRKVTRGTRGTKEEAKGDTEVQEVKVTKEGAKEGTRDGIREEVTKEAKEEVKQDSHSSLTPRGRAINAAAKVTSLITAERARMR